MPFTALKAGELVGGIGTAQQTGGLFEAKGSREVVEPTGATRGATAAKGAGRLHRDQQMHADHSLLRYRSQPARHVALHQLRSRLPVKGTMSRI